MWTSHTFLAHTKAVGDEVIDRWVGLVKDELSALRPGWVCNVTAGRDDYNRWADELGGWKPWADRVVNGRDYDGVMIYDELVVPVVLNGSPARPPVNDSSPTGRLPKVYVGRATADMIEMCMITSKPVYGWCERPGRSLGFVEVSSLGPGVPGSDGKRSWQSWASLVLAGGPRNASTKELPQGEPAGRPASSVASEREENLQKARALGQWQDFVEEAGYLIQLCEELTASKPNNEDFFSSVAGTVSDMKSWAEEHQHCTEKMQAALVNMKTGVEKWLR